MTRNERKRPEQREEIAVVKECDGKEAGEERREGGVEERRRQDRGREGRQCTDFPRHSFLLTSMPLPHHLRTLHHLLPVNLRPCTCQASSTPLIPALSLPVTRPSVPYSPLPPAHHHSSPAPHGPAIPRGEHQGTECSLLSSRLHHLTLKTVIIVSKAR